MRRLRSTLPTLLYLYELISGSNVLIKLHQIRPKKGTGQIFYHSYFSNSKENILRLQERRKFSAKTRFVNYPR